jgi:hypothetical protein
MGHSVLDVDLHKVIPRWELETYSLRTARDTVYCKDVHDCTSDDTADCIEQLYVLSFLRWLGKPL